MKNPEIAECLASKKRVRKVNPFTILAATVREASESKTGLSANVEHGGGVPNSYDYPADSECFGAVAVRTHGRGGRAYVRYAVIRANKITLSGAANATLGERAPWDKHMTDATAAYAALRARCWRDGDIRWQERISGVWYMAAGYGWRKASGKKTPYRDCYWQGKRLARLMRRVKPDGWSIVTTSASQGAQPTLAWREDATGEEYHLPRHANSTRYCVMDNLTAPAIAAFAQRSAQKETAALTALLDSGAASEVYVCAADSRRAGNCDAGTQSFAAQHGLDVTRHYRAAELLAICNGDARFVRAAVLGAMRREKIETKNGYALLSEHGI